RAVDRDVEIARIESHERNLEVAGERRGRLGRGNAPHVEPRGDPRAESARERGRGAPAPESDDRARAHERDRRLPERSERIAHGAVHAAALFSDQSYSRNANWICWPADPIDFDSSAGAYF